METKEMKKNADFLIKNLPGMIIPGSATLVCRYRKLVNLAKIYGITDPKYVGPEEDGIVACHAWANAYTVNALFKLVLNTKLTQDGKERPVLLNVGKLLHAGNIYDWEGCVDVKNGDKLTGKAKWGDFWLVEETLTLFGYLHLEVKNQNDELVCNVSGRLAVRPGGY